jgi:hypothetical protein
VLKAIEEMGELGAVPCLLSIIRESICNKENNKRTWREGLVRKMQQKVILVREYMYILSVFCICVAFWFLFSVKTLSANEKTEHTAVRWLLKLSPCFCSLIVLSL